MINYLRRFCTPLVRALPVLNNNIYYVGTEGPKKLELYQKIKQKHMGNISKNQLNQESIERYYTHHRCDGCNSILQSEDKEKYGYIKEETLQKSVKDNIKVIENTYGQKVKRAQSRVLQVVSHVQKELDVKIFNNQTKGLDNLDNVEVLLRLQEKFDQYEDQEQTIKRIKKQRTEIFCARCYSLKYYNKLPEQFDTLTDVHLNTAELLLTKVLKKHKNVPTFFMYVIDVLDIAGSFKKFVFDKLLAQNIEFCVVINKTDIINPKYLNKHLILDVVRKRMEQFVSDRPGSERTAILEKIRNIKVVLVTSTHKQGIKALEEYIENNLIKRIQIIGFPNTGKTTLLNQLARINKPTSKVPGTTIFITQHFFKKKVIYDMPGMHCEQNLSNKITRPNLKGLLTWNKFYSPPLFINNAFFFGGKVEIKGVKIILFGHGGACDSDNRWFILNFRVFWKGLPPLHQLKIKKHTVDLVFENGKSKDLEIAGWGFISFRTAYKDDKRHTRQLTLYLPEGIQFHLRESILKDSQVFDYKSIVKKRHRIERVHEQKRKQRTQKAKAPIV